MLSTTTNFQATPFSLFHCYDRYHIIVIRHVNKISSNNRGSTYFNVYKIKTHLVVKKTYVEKGDLSCPALVMKCTRDWKTARGS